MNQKTIDTSLSNLKDISKKVPYRLWKITVTVFLKEGVLDVEGRAVEQVLQRRGYDSVNGMRIGKCLTFNISAPDLETANATVSEIASNVLTNPLIETSTFTITPLDNTDKPTGYADKLMDAAEGSYL